MDSRRKLTISWSGGKDSAFALYKISQLQDVEVVHLHTLINVDTLRVGMHGVREEMIDRQAESLNLPLKKIYVQSSSSHEEYSVAMKFFYQQCKSDGIDAVVFGDIFLEDLRLYRETLLATSGLRSEYPLWKSDSSKLLLEFIDAGFKTIVCATNQSCYDANILGKAIDEYFAARLPAGIDHCGENGEYHTFLVDGPLFSNPLSYMLGEQLRKNYEYQVVDDNGTSSRKESVFWFQEILP